MVWSRNLLLFASSHKKKKKTGYPFLGKKEQKRRQIMAQSQKNM